MMSDTTAVCGESHDFWKFEDHILTEEHLQKASQELNETSENRIKCLEKLKYLIMGERNLKASTDDNFLLRFLRAKKFDVDEAFNLLKGYYTQKKDYPEIFSHLKVTMLENLLENKVFDYLPFRNTDGSSIFVYRPGFYDPYSVPLDEILRAVALALDWILQNPLIQIYGLTVIENAEDLTMGHVMSVTPSCAYRMMKIYREGLPLRLKALHIVKEPKIMSLIYEVVKPFLSNKIKCRITFHGKDMQSLHKYISPSILPEEFGGELGSLNNCRLHQKVLQHEKTFLMENEKFGYFEQSNVIKEKYTPLSDAM